MGKELSKSEKDTLNYVMNSMREFNPIRAINLITGRIEFIMYQIKLSIIKSEVSEVIKVIISLKEKLNRVIDIIIYSLLREDKEFNETNALSNRYSIEYRLDLLGRLNKMTNDRYKEKLDKIKFILLIDSMNIKEMTDLNKYFNL